MSLGRDDVHHIAFLARLTLTGDEEQTYAAQLSSILSYFERLEQLDTKDIEPTAHVVEMTPRLRDDEVVNRPEPERWMENAPERDERFFRVPKIIE